MPNEKIKPITPDTEHTHTLSLKKKPTNLAGEVVSNQTLGQHFALLLDQGKGGLKIHLMAEDLYRTSEIDITKMDAEMLKALLTEGNLTALAAGPIERELQKIIDGK